MITVTYNLGVPATMRNHVLDYFERWLANSTFKDASITIYQDFGVDSHDYVASLFIDNEHAFTLGCISDRDNPNKYTYHS